MATPHISAEKGAFAKTVLMPGDPHRARYIAETFLENPVLVNDTRGMLAYTGTYHGKPISVMGSGMGQPSIGIYSYELFKAFDVDNIIRIGTAGSYVEELDNMDIVLATSAFSESNYARIAWGYQEDELPADRELDEKIKASARELGVTLHEGCIHSDDCFYSEDHPGRKGIVERRNQHHCLCVEMESFALFANAKALGKKATCLITISDNLVTGERISAEQRQKGLNEMIRLALNTDF